MIFEKILFIYFLERGVGKEKERERNINVWLPLMFPQMGNWPTTQVCALTGNPISNHLVYKPMLNPMIYTTQGCTLVFWIHSFTNGHLGCIQHFTIVNCAAVNTGVHRFFWIGVSGFLGYNPKSGIASQKEVPFSVF